MDSHFIGLVFLVFTLYEPAKEGSKLQPNVAVILTPPTSL